jgi:hypothetical protein
MGDSQTVVQKYESVQTGQKTIDLDVTVDETPYSSD